MVTLSPGRSGSGCRPSMGTYRRGHAGGSRRGKGGTQGGGCSARRTWGPGAPLQPECSCTSDLTSSFPRGGLSLTGSDGRESACNAGDLGSILGSGRSPGEGNGNPFQYSCLENPMDGGAWWAAVHGVAESRTRLSDFTFTFTFTFMSERYLKSCFYTSLCPGQ